MTTPAHLSPLVCRPLRSQLPVVSNREFVRAWMARRAAARQAVPAQTPAAAAAAPAAGLRSLGSRFQLT